jgi:hypothetical protein
VCSRFLYLYTDPWQMMIWGSGVTEPYEAALCTLLLDLTSGSGFATDTDPTHKCLRMVVVQIAITHPFVDFIMLLIILASCK